VHVKRHQTCSADTTNGHGQRGKYANSLADSLRLRHRWLTLAAMAATAVEQMGSCCPPILSPWGHYQAIACYVGERIPLQDGCRSEWSFTTENLDNIDVTLGRCWRVAKIAGKGHGVVATRMIFARRANNGRVAAGHVLQRKLIHSGRRNYGGDRQVAAECAKNLLPAQSERGSAWHGGEDCSRHLALQCLP